MAGTRAPTPLRRKAGRTLLALGWWMMDIAFALQERAYRLLGRDPR